MPTQKTGVTASCSLVWSDIGDLYIHGIYHSSAHIRLWEAEPEVLALILQITQEPAHSATLGMS